MVQNFPKNLRTKRIKIKRYNNKKIKYYREG